MAQDPVEHFIELMGFFTQEDGLPRIAGQILGYLVAEGDPRTLNEISDALGISKASASTNCRLLAEKGALERVGALGTRQDSYRAADDPARRTLQSMSQRFGERADALDAAARAFPAERHGAQERVCNLAEFFRNSAEFLAQWDRHYTKSAAYEEQS
ncbi:GbsR/MarR family transcriptional regulator [Maritimibacter dapengensis]|uniref:MarR family transcriptional regulator n=1 Tax=Maritimibacter dapengensis TaxID=2836868 RepID=A0ABS6T122_9RHOB|nr:MarR family transcriptional regulator [Maritimibacter dapengensis]MBV7378924.1 MarR family transcriptional regulator [Maritimibacter dapengensis]